jgi:hypothetical protein
LGGQNNEESAGEQEYQQDISLARGKFYYQAGDGGIWWEGGVEKCSASYRVTEKEKDAAKIQ